MKKKILNIKDVEEESEILCGEIEVKVQNNRRR